MAKTDLPGKSCVRVPRRECAYAAKAVRPRRNGSQGYPGYDVQGVRKFYR